MEVWKSRNVLPSAGSFRNGGAHNAVYKSKNKLPRIAGAGIRAESMKRGSITAEEFSHWKAEARYPLDRTRAGEMSEAEFEAWLTQDIRTRGSMGKAAEPLPRTGE